jgi:hypothetical protein
MKVFVIIALLLSVSGCSTLGAVVYCVVEQNNHNHKCN